MAGGPVLTSAAGGPVLTSAAGGPVLTSAAGGPVLTSAAGGPVLTSAAGGPVLTSAAGGPVLTSATGGPVLTVCGRRSCTDVCSRRSCTDVCGRRSCTDVWASSGQATDRNRMSVGAAPRMDSIRDHWPTRLHGRGHSESARLDHDRHPRQEEHHISSNHISPSHQQQPGCPMLIRCVCGGYLPVVVIQYSRYALEVAWFRPLGSVHCIMPLISRPDLERQTDNSHPPPPGRGRQPVDTTHCVYHRVAAGRRRSQAVAGGRLQSPPVAGGRRRSPSVAGGRRRSPSVAAGRRRSPPVAGGRRRSPSVAGGRRRCDRRLWVDDVTHHIAAGTCGRRFRGSWTASQNSTPRTEDHAE